MSEDSGQEIPLVHLLHKSRTVVHEDDLVGLVSRDRPHDVVGIADRTGGGLQYLYCREKVVAAIVQMVRGGRLDVFLASAVHPHHAGLEKQRNLERRSFPGKYLVR